MIRSAFELAASEMWAVAPDRLELLLRIADRNLDSAEMVALRIRLGLPPEWTPKALATRDGRAVDSAHPGVEMRGDVAVVPLVGMMFRRANMFTDFSGGTSTEAFARAMQQTSDDSAVRAILMTVDSPGGEANGVNEAAKLILSIRGKKPIVAYASGMAASGAFWLATAADELVVDDTAIIGSVGVVTQVQKRADRDGVRTIEIVSSQSPNKRPDAETDEGRAAIQSRVDAMAEVFIGAVAKHRGVSTETVVNDFGRGGVMVGRQAVDAKAADRIGTFEGLIAELNKSTSSGRPGSIFPGASMSTNNENGADSVQESQITAAYIAEKHPQVADALRSEGRASGLEAGRAEGAKAERERIAALDEASMPGHEELLAKAKADGKSTGADLAFAIVRAEKAKGQGHLAALRADGQSLPKLDPPTGGNAGAPSKTGPLKDRVQAEWDRDEKVRGEFGDDFGAFLALREREERGLEKRR